MEKKMNPEENSLRSYFDLLPDEIKVKVFSYAGTPGIISFCEAYPSVEYLSHDKDTIRYVNFFKQYKYDGSCLQRFLTQKPRCDLITVLNINSVYWVPGGQLRKCIVKLVSLECLYAVDTKLGVTPEECMQYSSIKKLKKIGLSLLGKDLVVESVMFFPDLVGLYFHVYGCTINIVTYIIKLINRMEKLKEVWIVHCGFNNTQLSNLIYHIPPWINSATFVIHSYINNSKEIPLFTKTFESNKEAMQLTFEKCDDAVDIYSNWKIEHPIWNGLLNELHCDVPFGPKDTRQLALKQRDLGNIKFEELNFYHIDTVCCIRLQNLVYKAIMLPNSGYLKKLSINFCICDETWKRDYNLEPQHKRPKNGDGDDGMERANLRNIIKNCPHIEELEIWGCQQARSSSIPSLKYIKNLPKLKSLSLVEVPLHVDGSFLIEVCKSCLELRSLKITPLRLNAKININLLEALKYARNLRDFRFEHMFIPLQQVIEILTTHGKIKRLFLKCTTADDFSTALHPFASNNSQLVFIMIVCKEMPKTKLSTMQRILNRHKRSPVQLFYCTQSEDTFSGRFPIPEVHQREIIRRDTAVGVLDIFSGFA